MRALSSLIYQGVSSTELVQQQKNNRIRYYLLTSHYQGVSSTELVQQQKNNRIRYYLLTSYYQGMSSTQLVQQQKNNRIRYYLLTSQYQGMSSIVGLATEKQQDPILSADFTLSGNEFHRVGAATEKYLNQIFVLIPGVKRRWGEDDSIKHIVDCRLVQPQLQVTNHGSGTRNHRPVSIGWLL